VLHFMVYTVPLVQDSATESYCKNAHSFP